MFSQSKLIILLILNLLSPFIVNGQTENFRLPNSSLPLNYKLEFLTILDPLAGFERFTAPAKEWLTIISIQPSNVITLHAINLTINENTITVKDVATNTFMLIVGTSYTEAFDFFHIQLQTPTRIGQLYEIYIEFVAPISGDRLNGFYQDFYEDPISGETKYIATTLFAPYHARRAFPCFDEPMFRATYDITLGHHSKYHAMSNTEIIESRLIDNLPGWQWDTFSTTPSISSYIIAMIVSDMEFEEAPVNVFRNVSVRVYAKPQSIQQGAGTYSAKLSGDVMTFFESLFVIPYPLSKLYSVALPQFFFNAMENWGLITYKEPVLLYIQGETTEEDRYRINYVLSHEKAHQYFGNLVACKWWAYVYLKEGFATYYSHHGMNHTNPELDPWNQFIPRILFVALEFDASNETHPLENFPVSSPAVADIYTAIPYQKGASILRMASNMISSSVFLAGIKQYVNAFQYQSAEQNDVFEMLQRAVNAEQTISLPTSVKEILDSWTTQSGFPVISVTAINNNTLLIHQEKFIDGDQSNPNDKWWVPLQFSPRLNESLPQDIPDAWIPQAASNITIDIATDQLILLDPNSIGYYRVLYDTKMLQNIELTLVNNHADIPASARSKLLNDYGAFVLTGYADFKDLFTLISYLGNEQELVVWQGISSFLEKMSNLLSSTHVYNTYKQYFGQKAAEALKLLELTNNDEELEIGTKSMLRSFLHSLACKYDEKNCIQQSLNFIPKVDILDIAVPLSVEESTLCAIISFETNQILWDEILQQLSFSKSYDKEFSPKRSRMSKALTCTRNAVSMKKLVEMVIQSQDVSYFSASEKVDMVLNIAKNPLGKKTLTSALMVSPSIILDMFKTNSDMREFLNTISSYDLSDIEMETLEQLLKFIPTEWRQTGTIAIHRAERNRLLLKKIIKPLENVL